MQDRIRGARLDRRLPSARRLQRRPELGVNSARKSLEYGCRYPVEHFVGWAHVLDVAEVGCDLLTRVSARMNRHLAHVVQEPDGIADVSTERGDRAGICLLRRNSVGGGGEVDGLPEGPAGGVAVAWP